MPKSGATKKTVKPVGKRSRVPTEDSKSDVFTCDKCTYVTDRRCFMADHYRVHTGERPFICKICGKAFTQRSNLGQHLKVHGGGDKKFYNCAHCDFTSKWKTSLQQHERWHNGEKPFKCETCGRTFSQSTHCRSHIREAHMDDRRFQCGECNKRFKRQDHLDRHILFHVNDRKFECTVCHRKYVEQRYLNTHMRIHQGEATKIHLCPKCPYKSRYRQGLKIHMRTHTGSKPYKCTSCTKCFVTSQSLRLHSRMIHQGEAGKIFRCDRCSFATANNQSLKGHVRRVHLGIKDPVLQVKCPYCSRVYRNRSSLCGHKLRRHPKQVAKERREQIMMMKERNAKLALQENDAQNNGTSREEPKKTIVESVTATSTIIAAVSKITDEAGNAQSNASEAEVVDEASAIKVISESEALLKTVGNVRLNRRTRSTLVAMFLQAARRRGKRKKVITTKTLFTGKYKPKRQNKLRDKSQPASSETLETALVTPSTNERLRIKLVKTSSAQFVCVTAKAEPGNVNLPALYKTNNSRREISETNVNASLHKQNANALCESDNTVTPVAEKVIALHSLPPAVEVRATLDTAVEAVAPSTSQNVSLKLEAVCQEEPLDYSLKTLSKTSLDHYSERDSNNASNDCSPILAIDLSINTSKKVASKNTSKILSKNHQEISSIGLIKDFLKNTSKCASKKSSKKQSNNSNNLSSNSKKLKNLSQKSTKNASKNTLNISSKNVMKKKLKMSPKRTNSKSSDKTVVPNTSDVIHLDTNKIFLNSNIVSKISKNKNESNVTSPKTKSIKAPKNNLQKKVQPKNKSFAVKNKSATKPNVIGPLVKPNIRRTQNSFHIQPEVYIDRDYCENTVGVPNNPGKTSGEGFSQLQADPTDVKHAGGTLIGTVDRTDQSARQMSQGSGRLVDGQQHNVEVKHDVEHNLGYASLRALAADFLNAE